MMMKMRQPPMPEARLGSPLGTTGPRSYISNVSMRVFGSTGEPGGRRESGTEDSQYLARQRNTRNEQGLTLARTLLNSEPAGCLGFLCDTRGDGSKGRYPVGYTRKNLLLHLLRQLRSIHLQCILAGITSTNSAVTIDLLTSKGPRNPSSPGLFLVLWCCALIILGLILILIIGPGLLSLVSRN